MGGRTTTRQKMLVGGTELLREHGANGVTIDAILERTKTPRGSVYHHFPGGRSQIVSEALETAGEAISAVVDEAVKAGPSAGLEFFAKFWRGLLEASDFQAGCPIAGVALGGSAEDRRLDPKLAAFIEHWCTSIADSLVATGVEPERAATLATITVSAMEGALILCRTTHSTGPLDDVVSELQQLLAAAQPKI